MPLLFRQAQVLNQTRGVALATELALADSHWSRFRGLLGSSPGDFRNGRALWIVPCRGVHTLGMGFPIDVVYLDRDQQVVHLEANLKPWRFASVRMQALSVLEFPRQSIAETGTSIGDKIEIRLD